MKILARVRINVAAKDQLKYQEAALHHVADNIKKNQQL